MRAIPDTENALVLRSDFGDDAAWNEICAAIRKPVGTLRFQAYVDYLDDPIYEGIDVDRLLALIPAGYNHSFIIVADSLSMSHPEHPLLVVDLYEGSGQSFRAIPGQIQSIENNLSIANVDFDEFASAVDGDGIYRGFPRT